MRRYARHLVLPEIGEAGQRTLLASSVLIIGAGGLGASAIGYLAAMGIGRIGLVDEDRVELSNLNRQILYEPGDDGRLKVEAAKDRLEEINPDCRVEIYPFRFPDARIPLAEYDLILDCLDNFTARFAVHAACYQAHKPLVSAAISGFSAQASTFKAYLGAPHPCYHCLVAEMPVREIACAQEGILGALAGMMGAMQAAEAVKELLGIGQSLSGWLWRHDALSAQTVKTRLPRDPACSFCAVPLASGKTSA